MTLTFLGGVLLGHHVLLVVHVGKESHEGSRAYV